jgi:hypothetical protein
MHHEAALRLALQSDNATRDPATWMGTWKNQMGSTMTLRVTGDEISGSYTSVDSSSDKPVTSLKLHGYVASDLISFIVLWPGGSQTAWTGQLVDDKSDPTIRTLWHLVTDIADAEEPTRLWRSTLAGADQFKRV